MFAQPFSIMPPDPRARRTNAAWHGSALALALATWLLPAVAGAVALTIPASKDNTLYEPLTPGAYTSNGSGERIFTGRTKGGFRRRAVIHFDVASSIPPGSTINSVTLQMRVSRVANSTPRTTILHRLLADWGEGTSNADQQEGQGTTPTPGDATWIHRFYPGTLWAAAGGDFDAGVRGSVVISGTGVYTWSGASLVADVQAWLDNSTSNFGWLIQGDESTPETSKRFDSSEAAQTANRPALIVDYTPPSGVTGACCYADTCGVMTSAACASLGGTYQGNGTSCTPNPCPPPPEPTGACCYADGICDTLTQTQCLAASGTYQGDGTACTPGLCPLVLTPYVDPLPRPAVATPVSGTPGGAADYSIAITEFVQKLHRDLPPTRVWGYAGSYPGPTIEASTGQPVHVTWMNDLRDSLGVLRTTHYLPVDLCLHGPDSLGASPRVVPHLHGGHVPAAVDGHPDSTFLPGQQVTYAYPNNQQAGTLWYHDHALGITRLNVMMGLAGFYLVRDPVENALGLPAGEYEIPLAIQDRSFSSDGSLQYPAMWMEHFFGDKMLVNGKVWPYLQVKQGKYRFRLLNGCNSRMLHLSLSNAAAFQVIGTEDGLLPAPVDRTSLLLAPGERADIVIDFAGYPDGTQIVLANDAPAPYPGTPGEGVIPNVMRFNVVGTPGSTAPLPGALRAVTPIDTLEAVQTRDFHLRKTTDPCTGSMWMINDLGFDDITEHPVLGTTEIWRFINESGISHPMHMHLVSFQILDRQPFALQGGQPVPTGPRVPPDASEAGWKDTAIVGPNEMLRVIARFEDYAGYYSYHCHILEHEDHEMMRQFRSVAAPAVSIGDATVIEGNSGAVSASFAVTLSSAVQSEVRVVAFTEDATAAAGADYAGVVADTLVFPPLATSQTLTVPVLGDLADEFDETFLVRLASPSVATLGDSVALGTIVDDDVPPAFSVNDVAVAEGQADTTLAAFTVSLSAPSGKPVVVHAATEDGTALAGPDYVPIAPPLELAFAPGDTVLTRHVTVRVLGETVVEPDESFFVVLSTPQNATLADSVSLGTIVNDDGIPVVSVNDVSVTEGSAGSVSAAFTVALSSATASPVRVVATTQDGNATAGADYVATGPDTLVFPPLTTQQAWTVPVLGDLVDEFDEIFQVRLVSAVGAALVDSTGTGTIVDDDAAPAISVNDISVTEGNADTTLAVFAVSRSSRSQKPVQVQYGTRDGSATSGVDYVPISPARVLAWAPGDTALTRNVTVRVLGETVNESDESFFLDLGAPVYATLADSVGQCTIVNDDVPTDLAGGAAAPLVSYLEAGAPNPFSSQVMLRWGLHAPGRVEMTIFDVTGRRVRQLVSGDHPAGHKAVVWDGRDQSGRSVSNGVYMVRLRTPERTVQRRILHLR